MFKAIIKYSLVIIIVLLVINWSDVVNIFSLNRGVVQSDIAYPDEKYEIEVSHLLNEMGVRNKIDREGVLRYNYRNQKEVDEAYRIVMARYKPDWPSAWFGVESIRKELVSYLESREIPFKIRKVGEDKKEHIFWATEFDSDVREYYKHLLNEYINNKNHITNQ